MSCSVNWFRYRLPNSPDVVCGGSLNLINDLGDGFVIAPFRNPAEGIMTIPFDFIPCREDLRPFEISLPQSTLKSEHNLEVRSIIKALADKNGKIVAARALRLECCIDLESTFEYLCKSYQDAFVFMFYTPATGVWFGASPELLLHKSERGYKTMALAGTRPVGHDATWDLKNREEQSMVTSFISSVLSKYFEIVDVGKTFTKVAGCVEHICTEIYATNPLSALASQSNEFFREVLCDLSPTPALCGSDRLLAFGFIDKFEKFDRELYGGFCGPNNINGVSALYVNLRSAKCSDTEVALFAGGGITSLSDPEQEWEETEYKLKTIITKIKTKNET